MPTSSSPDKSRRNGLPITRSSDRPVTRSDAASIHEYLKSYAQRGVFRSFSQTRADKGQTEFRFYWLWNLSFDLIFDVRRRALVFKKLLPAIPSKSALEADLKAFIKSRCSAEPPEHRGIDSKRVAVRYSNRQGAASLEFLLQKKDDYEYGVRKALNLVHEIFVGFLSVYYPEYMTENFHRPEE